MVYDGGLLQTRPRGQRRLGIAVDEEGLSERDCRARSLAANRGASSVQEARRTKGPKAKHVEGKVPDLTMAVMRIQLISSRSLEFLDGLT